jgi:hypothetical protein
MSGRTILAAVVSGPPVSLHQLNPAVPAELAAICEKAMARVPEDRYAETLAMADDLRAYLENRVVEGPTRPARPPSSRSGWCATAAWRRPCWRPSWCSRSACW